MICEGCIKQDTCKFKGEVEKYEERMNTPTPDAPKNPLVWPLEVTVTCRCKKTEPLSYTYPNLVYPYYPYSVPTVPYEGTCDASTTTTWDNGQWSYTIASN